MTGHSDAVYLLREVADLNKIKLTAQEAASGIILVENGTPPQEVIVAIMCARLSKSTW